MFTVVVHKRVHEKHPELDEADVLYAWNNWIASTARTGIAKGQYVKVGWDNKGRLLEMVGVLCEDEKLVIFHAMTPPSNKTYRELRIEALK